jgi:hypothetical protein
VATRVVASFDSPAGDHCVDIFERDDGTFGFEEYRRDAEDLRGWFPLHRYSQQVFATDDDALAQAKATVAWMAAERR